MFRQRDNFAPIGRTLHLASATTFRGQGRRERYRIECIGHEVEGWVGERVAVAVTGCSLEWMCESVLDVWVQAFCCFSQHGGGEGDNRARAAAEALGHWSAHCVPPLHHQIFSVLPRPNDVALCVHALRKWTIAVQVARNALYGLRTSVIKNARITSFDRFS